MKKYQKILLGLLILLSLFSIYWINTDGHKPFESGYIACINGAFFPSPLIDPGSEGYSCFGSKVTHISSSSYISTEFLSVVFGAIIVLSLVMFWLDKNQKTKKSSEGVVRFKHN